MKFKHLIVATAAAISSGTLPAQTPPLINYQGRVVVGTTNFDGTGQFQFALVNGGVNLNTQATAFAMGGGQVFFIGVVTGGSGYTSPPTVTINDATGTGAQAIVTISPEGTVIGIQVTQGGSGYSPSPEVTISPPPPNIVTTTYWSNDQSSTNGGEPINPVPLQVTRGLYSVPLGDNSLGPVMRTMDAADFAHPDLRLRVWFDDGINGSQLLTPDQRLAPAAYLADGAVGPTTLADGSITSSKIASGAVGAEKLGAGAINVSHLGVPAAPSLGQVLSYNDTDLAWAAPGGAGADWLLGGNAGTTASNFLGTTDNQNLVFKTKNLERLRLTTTGDLLLQKPDTYPSFSIRNGLGVYGISNGFDDVGKTFAGTNVLGPVLYGQSGGGLGSKSSTNVETLALRWNSLGVTVSGNLTICGGYQLAEICLCRMLPSVC